jgi:uncharacterized membrane protein
MSWLTIVRWVHILSGAAWFGEVIIINFVLLPLLKPMGFEQRALFLHKIFPRVFRLASFLSVLALSSGLIMSYLITGWKDLDVFLSTRWGVSILIGGSLGLLLTMFHFFVESRLEPLVASLNESPQQMDVERITRFLQYIPRAGLLVILTTFILMMVAARGI